MCRCPERRVLIKKIVEEPKTVLTSGQLIVKSMAQDVADGTKASKKALTNYLKRRGLIN